jgi:hypothetical protein
MKSCIRKPFVQLIGAIAILGFMISAVVAQQQKNAKREADAKATAPTQAGPTDPATLTAPLKAKIGANMVTVNKKAPVSYKPITLAELKDPATGKAPSATTKLKLLNGKEVPAATYVAAIDKLEKEFNALGYSLRTGPAKVTLQQVQFNKPLLDKQAAAAKAFKPVDAKAQSMATSPKPLQEEYATAVKAYKANAASAKATTAEGEEGTKTKGTTGAKGTERAKADKATTAEGAKGAAGTGKSNTAAGAAAAGTKAEVGAGGLGINRALQPFSTTKSFDDKWGDPSVLGAEVSASLTFKGDSSSASLSGSAKATGSILGNTEDLAVATAALNAPKTGNLTANVKVTVLGADVAVLNESQSVDFNKQDTYSKSLPDSFKVSYQFSIGPVPVKAVVGAKGSFTMPYYVALLPLTSTAWMIPTVQASIYAQAAVDLEYEDTGAEAGVEADLTLLNNKLTLAGGASEGTDTTGTFVSYWLTSRDDLTVLAGKLTVYVKVQVEGYTVHEFDEDFYNYAGIQSTFTPIAGGEKVYLQPISSIQTPTRAR